MTFSYTLSLWDYSEALRLHRHQKASRRVRFLLLYRVIPLLSAAGLVLLGAFNSAIATLHSLPGWILQSYAIAWLWIGILLASSPRNNIRRGFKRAVPAGQTTISVDDECILMQVPGVIETKWFWNGIAGVAQNQELLLLYTGKDCFLIFPTSKMTMEQRTELDTLIDRNVARK